MLCVMTLTLPLPSPPGNGDRRLSRALNSAGRFPGLSFAVAELHPIAAVQQVNSDISRGASSSWRKKALRTSRDEFKVEDRGQGLAVKRKEPNDAKQHLSRHRQPKNKRPEPIITPSNHSTVVKLGLPAAAEQVEVWSLNTRGAEPHTGQESRGGREKTWKLAERLTAERRKADKKQSQRPKRWSKTGGDQQVVEVDFGDPIQPSYQPSQTRDALSKLDRASQSDPCPSWAEQDFSEGDRRLIRVSSHLKPLPWFSEDDLKKMELLASAEVTSKVKVPAHGQVLQVALEHREVKQVTERFGLLPWLEGAGNGGDQDFFYIVNCDFLVSASQFSS